jgi:hypothetical protein
MMMSSLPAVVLILTGLVFAASEIHAREEKPTYSFQYSGLKYSSSTSSEKPKGGTSTDVNTTVLSTSGVDSYGWVTLGQWNFYLLPFAYGDTTIGLSYMATENLELGSFLGLKTVRGDDKASESNTTSITPFVTYYATLGRVTLENYLALSISQGKAKAEVAGTLVDVKSSSTGLGLLVTAVYPLAKNFFFVPSVAYNMSNGDIKTGDSDLALSSSGFALTPIAIRTSFD